MIRKISSRKLYFHPLCPSPVHRHHCAFQWWPLVVTHSLACLSHHLINQPTKPLPSVHVPQQSPIFCFVFGCSEIMLLSLIELIDANASLVAGSHGPGSFLTKIWACFLHSSNAYHDVLSASINYQATNIYHCSLTKSPIARQAPQTTFSFSF